MTQKIPTACLLIIGNEVLSGRTRDANLQFIATRLGEIGIPLREVRVIPDIERTIIDTVNEAQIPAELRTKVMFNECNHRWQQRTIR